MRSLKVMYAAAVLAALPTTSCLQSDSDALPAIAGPFDGSYRLISRTCGGTDITVNGTVSRYVVKGAQGTYSDMLIDNCVIASTAVLTYPSPGVVSSTVQKVTCTTNCSGVECTPVVSSQPPQTLTYSIQGSSLLLTQAGAHEGCAASEVAAFDR